jgi:DNA (cytosine-5)-methyltransferase 1
LTKYYGAGAGARPVNEPLDTITAKDRFALVEPVGMDIRFRMLQPQELAAAMGFDGYEFAGTKTDQVRQIGNAVAVRTAKALCGAMIDAGRKDRFEVEGRSEADE